MDFSCSLQMRLISSSATIKQGGELLWIRPLLLLHLLPKFAVCAVPTMASFGSRSFSWPISGSPRDSLEPWDITKHFVHAILKAASGQDRLKSRTWRQRTGIDKICISLLNTVCNCGLLWKSTCLESSEQQKSAAFHLCLGDFVSETKHNRNIGSWKLCLNSSPYTRNTSHVQICFVLWAVLLTCKPVWPEFGSVWTTAWENRNTLLEEDLGFLSDPNLCNYRF